MKQEFKVQKSLLSYVDFKSGDGSQFAEDSAHRFPIAASYLIERQRFPVFHREPSLNL